MWQAITIISNTIICANLLCAIYNVRSAKMLGLAHKIFMADVLRNDYKMITHITHNLRGFAIGEFEYHTELSIYNKLPSLLRMVFSFKKPKMESWLSPLDIIELTGEVPESLKSKAEQN